MDNLEATKALVTAIIATGNAIGAALADGKLSIGDALDLWKPLVAFSHAVGTLGQVPGELAQIDEAGRKELEDYCLNNLQIPETEVQAAVDAGIQSAFALWSLIARVLKKPA